jgi:hypothetical protein
MVQAKVETVKHVLMLKAQGYVSKQKHIHEPVRLTVLKKLKTLLFGPRDEPAKQRGLQPGGLDPRPQPRPPATRPPPPPVPQWKK